MEGSLNGDEHGGIGLEEVEDEVIKDDDKFRIIEPIATTTSSGSST